MEVDSCDDDSVELLVYSVDYSDGFPDASSIDYTYEKKMQKMIQINNNIF